MTSGNEHDPVAVECHQIYVDEKGDRETIVCEVESKGYGGFTNQLNRFDYCPACGRSLHWWE